MVALLAAFTLAVPRPIIVLKAMACQQARLSVPEDFRGGATPRRKHGF